MAEKRSSKGASVHGPTTSCEVAFELTPRGRSIYEREYGRAPRTGRNELDIMEFSKIFGTHDAYAFPNLTFVGDVQVTCARNGKRKTW